MSPGLSIVSGNGQVNYEQYLSSAPLVVEARDASGKPIPNLALTWTVSQGQGTISHPSDRTDANGQGSASFIGNVTPGYSFSQQAITVSSSAGTVTFIETSHIKGLPNGPAELPLAVLQSPPPEDRTLKGSSGATIPGAIVVQVAVQTGPQSGSPIQNVAIRIIDPTDPNARPPAQCAGGQALTDKDGFARCDLALTGSPGTYGIAVDVGSYRTTPGILLTIRPAGSCTYTVTTQSAQFPVALGIGTVTVTAPSDCPWTASSNANWISITSGVSGTGSGGVAFRVEANPGASRSGTLTVAGQTINITQAGTTPGGGQALSIISPATLTAVAGTAFTASLTASGGTPPYRWATPATFPAGLTLNPSTGGISGTPSAAGTYTIPLTVSDQAGSTVGQTLTLTVMAAGTPPTGNFYIQNTSLSNGVVGIAYSQVLTSVGGCGGLFGTPPTFKISSGSLPPGLNLTTNDRTYLISGIPTTAGTSNFTLTVTDSCNNSASTNFSLTITGGTPQPSPLAANPTSLSFSLPGNAQDQTIALTGPATNFTAAASSVGNWLSLAGTTNGPLPATLTARVTNIGLASGTYQGSITILSAVGTLTIPVSLSVTSTAAALTVSPMAIDTGGEAGGAPVQQTLSITNAGGGTAAFALLPTTATGGSWLTVNTLTGSAPGSITATMNPFSLTPGTYAGIIQIVPTNPPGASQNIPVTFRVAAPPGFVASPATVTFTAGPGQTAPPAQSVLVASTNFSVQGTVSVTTTSGDSWLVATPSNGFTPFFVNVSVNPAGLRPGTYKGFVSISTTTPGLAPFSVPVTLNYGLGGPAIAGITNAASFAQGAVSPGEIVTLFGSGIGPSALVASHVNAVGALDTLIGETQVYFDDIPAPMIYTRGDQVSAIVPYGVQDRTTTKVQVEYRGVRSPAVQLQVVPASPGIFTFSATGQGGAAALNEDTTINSPSTGAEPGSIIVLYATGEGQTTPAGTDGKLATDAVLPQPVLPVTVTIGGEDAEVLYHGAAPQLAAGLMQINTRIPADVPRGSAVPVTIAVGGTPSQSGVVIYTKP